MRRFSQRNSLVTLSDINITPLLDLAFVLLIIFVIISPSIRSQQEQGMKLDLNSGGNPDSTPREGDVRRVEIDRRGQMMLDRRLLSPEQIERELVRARQSNPRVIVDIAADRSGPNMYLFDIIERCQRNGISTFSLRTQPPNPNR